MSEPIEKIYNIKITVEFKDNTVLSRSDVHISSDTVLAKNKCSFLNPHISLLPRKSSHREHRQLSKNWDEGRIRYVDIRVSNSYGGWYKEEDEFTSFHKNSKANEVVNRKPFSLLVFVLE